MPSAPTIGYFNQHSQQPAASSQQPGQSSLPPITLISLQSSVQHPRRETKKEGKERNKERMNNNPYGDPSRRDRDMPSVAGGSYSYRSSSGMPMPPPHHPPDAPSIYSQQLVPLPPDGYAMSVAGRSSAVGGGGDDVSQLGDRTFESRARSIAGSAALVPKAKYSWASESLGTQSTVMTRRSLATASIPEPEMQRSSTAAAEGRMWASFAWIVTFMIPNKCIMRPTKDAKQAWREKVALFVIMVSCSVFFVGVFGFVPLLLCKEDTIFSLQDIWLQSGENWVVVHGLIYDVKDLINRHPGGVDGVVMFLGKDASKVFPPAPPVALPQKCRDKINESRMPRLHRSRRAPGHHLPRLRGRQRGGEQIPRRFPTRRIVPHDSRS